MAYERVAQLGDLWDGDMMACAAAGRKILLVRLGNEVFAHEDRCAHLGMPLSAGRLENGVLICSAHLYEYDARTGKGRNPYNVCLRTFPVKLDGGWIWVDAAPENGHGTMREKVG